MRTLIKRIFFFIAGSETVKSVLRNQRLAPLAARWLAKRIKILHDTRQPGALTVLVFSAFRYRQDLSALAASGRFRFLSLDPESMGILNAVFRNRSQAQRGSYFCETDRGELELRNLHQRFTAKVMASLCKRFRIDAVVTPAIHYRSEFEWCRGCVLAGIPAVAIHKEFTLIGPDHVERRMTNYKENKTRFMGSRVLTTNRSGQELFTAAGIHDPARVRMVGLPRADRILGPDSPFRTPRDRRIVTLFSFGHFSGEMTDIPEDRRSHYFSWGNDQGFVGLVHGTHGAIAKAALLRPDTQFLIKPKYVTDEWAEVIHELVQATTGRDIDSIPNLKIVDEEAPALMRDSVAVIGFNSTVVIESRILGRPTIVPMFAEAAGALNRFVYFNEHIDLFEQPNSEEALLDRVVALVDGQPTIQRHDPAMLNSFIEKHLGYADGRTGERVWQELLHAIEDVAAVRAAILEDAGDNSIAKHRPELAA